MVAHILCDCKIQRCRIKENITQAMPQRSESDGSFPTTRQVSRICVDLAHLKHGYRPIRVLKPEKKSTRLDPPRGQAQHLKKARI